MSTKASEANGQTTAQERSTTDRIAESAHKAVDDAANRAKSVEDDLRDRARRTGDKVDATQDAAIQSVREATAQAEAFAKERPLAAAGIAFAAGLLTASILRR